MKIDAGWKFQRRNPSRDPASAKHSTPMNGWLVAVVIEISPSVTAAISAMPDDSPSRPSMKLMLLIIPTIQTIVNPIAYGPVEDDVAGAERVVEEGHRDPGHDGERRRARPGRAAASGRGAGACRRGRRGSSPRPRRRAGRPAPSGRSCAGSCTMSSWSFAIRIADRDDEERGRHGDAAAARDRPLVDPAVIGEVDVVEPDREPPDERRDQQRDQRRRRERHDEEREHLAERRDQAHRVVRRRPAGGPDGEAGDQLAHLAPDPLVDGLVVAVADRLDDPAARSASSPPGPCRASSWPASRPGSRTRCWAGSRRTGSRSC